MASILTTEARQMASKFTRAARGQDCQVRIPGVCNFDPDTSVFAHLKGGGMGFKQTDLYGAIACSSCHDVIDGRVKRPARFTKSDIDLMHYQGMPRTLDILIRSGILVL